MQIKTFVVSSFPSSSLRADQNAHMLRSPVMLSPPEASKQANVNSKPETEKSTFV